MNSLESRLLSALTPWLAAPGWRVAFSGGLDSTVLLHLLTRLAQQQRIPPLSAIHIQHGLQRAAQAWPAHCQTVCNGLEVPLQIESVQVESGASLEQAARQARYGAFATLLAPGEVLLTAQHGDDQAETLLFRLARGSGVKGMAGMPVQRPLGMGHLLRPLLNVSRAELQTYAQEQELAWVEDPSNLDSHYSRNFLRKDVLPLLESRWPAMQLNLRRSAGLFAESQQLLDELAAMDLAAAQDSVALPWLPLPSLALAPLCGLSDARQRNALRAFLAPLTRLPDLDHWAGWISLRDAAVDATPVWRLAQGELRRANGRIWWLSECWQQEVAANISWQKPNQLLLLPGNGELRLLGEPPAGVLEIRYRQGGEELTITGRGRRDLKRLLNEAGVPNFVRSRLPLLYADERLLAVANFPRLSAALAPKWQLQWMPPISAQGLS